MLQVAPRMMMSSRHCPVLSVVFGSGVAPIWPSDPTLARCHRKPGRVAAACQTGAGGGHAPGMGEQARALAHPGGPNGRQQ